MEQDGGRGVYGALHPTFGSLIMRMVSFFFFLLVALYCTVWSLVDNGRMICCDAEGSVV